MPTKLFEYLGAGLPVIISDTLRCSQIVKEHNCGVVVNPEDPDAIARAITLIVENPQIARAMGERGRLIVAERYQWTSEANKLRQLYAEIA
jgi:glycosyltransferase involved in cell wall biosynthesis